MAWKVVPWERVTKDNLPSNYGSEIYKAGLIEEQINCGQNRLIAPLKQRLGNRNSYIFEYVVQMDDTIKTLMGTAEEGGWMFFSHSVSLDCDPADILSKYLSNWWDLLIGWRTTQEELQIIIIKFTVYMFPCLCSCSIYKNQHHFV